MASPTPKKNENENDASRVNPRPRVVIIDSGVHRSHPHILDRVNAAITVGPTVLPDGQLVDDPDQTDRLGHGTCAAAAILEVAPLVELITVKVFHDVPSCPFAHVMTALEWALTELASGEGPTFVNLSLGTTKHEWRAPLTEIVERAVSLAVQFVAPATFNNLPSYPGVVPGVSGVLIDANRPRDEPRFCDEEDHRYWYASPFPRDLPGVPRPANLSGGSMACANVVAYLAARASKP